MQGVKATLGRIALLALALLVARPLLAAPDGHALFQQNCAVCHGENGHGGVGIPLALPNFLTSVSDEFLFRTIRTGRPGRVMPAFDELSDAQVKAIIGFIRTWMPEGSKVPKPDYTPIKGNVAHGKALFAKNCAVCHGANGQGGHGTGVTFSRPRDLPIIPPALNNPGFLHAASDRMIMETLEKGREGTPMVSFLKHGLSHQDIRDVVAYVRSFQQHPLHWKPADTDKPILEYDSPYSLKETVEAVKRAAVGRNFRIIRVQYLDQGMVPAGQEDKHQVIIYFCNFGFINKALALDPRVGLYMPCRITVVQSGDTVKVMSINPKYQSRMFNNRELDQPCSQMHDTYVSILEEATL